MARATGAQPPARASAAETTATTRSQSVERPKPLAPVKTAKRGRRASVLTSPHGRTDDANTDDDDGIEDAVETTQPSRKKITIMPVSHNLSFDLAETDEPLATLSTNKRSIARITTDGLVVSAKDGRPILSANHLQERFPASYRNPENTTKFAGRLLEIGQSFKLAVLVRYVFSQQLKLIIC